MNIWKSEDLLTHTEICEGVFPVLGKNENGENHFPSFKIAIVGGGPKGLYGLIGLLSTLCEEPRQTPVEIHWYNKTAYFATGEYYRIDQPEFLLMNGPIDNVTMWDSKDNFTQKMTLVDWIKENVSDSRAVQKNDLASRSLVGCYLKAGTLKLLESLPPQITVKCIVGEVLEVFPAPDRENFSVEVNGKPIIHGVSYNYVLLANGHFYKYMGEEVERMNDFSHQSRIASYITQLYPVNEKLASIKNTDKVCIKGMGLSFIDAVLALTEGRGGRFCTKNNRICYEPSGKEPLSVYAFSNLGAPVLPKVPDHSITEEKLYYINEEWVQGLILKCGKGNIDFEVDVLPFLEKEYRIRYYKFCSEQLGFLTDYSDDIWLNNLDQVIRYFHELNPAVKPFDLRMLFNPFDNRKDIEACGYHRLVMNYLEEVLNETETDEFGIKNPRGVLAWVWRDALPYIRHLYVSGGFTALSRVKFETEYLHQFNRMSFGAPAINIQKIIALARSGHVYFRLGTDTEVSTNAATGKFRIYSHQTKYCREVKVFIDAHIAKQNLEGTGFGIYQSMLKRRPAGVYGSISHVSVGSGKRANKNDGQGKVLQGISLMDIGPEELVMEGVNLSRNTNSLICGWLAAIKAEIHRDKDKSADKVGV